MATSQRLNVWDTFMDNMSRLVLFFVVFLSSNSYTPQNLYTPNTWWKCIWDIVNNRLQKITTSQRAKLSLRWMGPKWLIGLKIKKKIKNLIMCIQNRNTCIADIKRKFWKYYGMATEWWPFCGKVWNLAMETDKISHTRHQVKSTTTAEVTLTVDLRERPPFFNAIRLLNGLKSTRKTIMPSEWKYESRKVGKCLMESWAVRTCMYHFILKVKKKYLFAMLNKINTFFSACYLKKKFFLQKPIRIIPCYLLIMEATCFFSW